MEKKRALFKRPIQRWEHGRPVKRCKDVLVAEEPFTVVWHGDDGVGERLASTMRTPGDDISLAAGMLFCEGAVTGKAEIKGMSFCAGGAANQLNRLSVELRLSSECVKSRLAHRPSAGIPQSACGMCALDDLSSPEALLKWSASRYRGYPERAGQATLMSALEFLGQSCPVFEHTGASHACVVIAADGLLKVAEDVGRHNACDKALGSLLLETESEFSLPPGAGILFSSRLSFELASKATAAGVSWMGSVGAPTHLAVELTRSLKIPLYGFVGPERYNLYSG